MKTRTINTAGELDALVQSVTGSATKSLAQIAKLGSDGLRAIWSMKFEPIGCDPLDCESPLNLIEQLNQSFTYIASARATKILIARHPELAPFTLNLGTAGGSDIESKAGVGVAAEVFAAVNTSNNRKLASDIAKVSATAAGFKYVFFMCPGYEEGYQPKWSHSGVEVWSVGATL
jgi:hypothetical protein